MVLTIGLFFQKFITAKWLKEFIWLSILFYSISLSYSQPFAIASEDSLLKQIESTLDPKRKIDLILELENTRFFARAVSGIATTAEVLQESRRIGYREGEALALTTHAHYHLMYGDRALAVVYADSAIAISELLKNDHLRAKALHGKGLALQILGKYDLALLNFHEALEINSRLGKVPEMVKQLNNIALVRRELKDYNNALKAIFRMKTLAQKNGDTAMVARADINTAYIYLDQEKYEKAREYIDLSLDHYLGGEKEFEKNIAYTINAQVCAGLGKYEEALESAQKGLAIAQELTIPDGITAAQYALANTYYRQGAYKKAIEVAENGIKGIDTSLTTRYVDQLYFILSDSYQKLGAPQQALDYLNTYNVIRDKIFALDKQRIAMRLDVDYNIKEKERENEQLRREVELDKRRIKNQRYLYFASSFLALTGLVLAFSFYNSLSYKKKHSKRLEESIEERTKELRNSNLELKKSNEELERFAYIASHDLKEPLTNIMSFSGLLEKELKTEKREDKVDTYLSFIQAGSSRLYNLVESVLEYSKINNTLLQFDSVELNGIVCFVCDQIMSTPSERENVILSESLPVIKGNPSLITSVFYNIIQNGIKFNASQQAEIMIRYSESSSMEIIEIIDNGIGIEEEYQQDIFKMFKRLNPYDSFRGSGMGLASCKKIMELHKGEISLKSEVGKGSSFFLSFPKQT